MLQMQSCDLHFLPPGYVNAQKVQHFAVALLTLQQLMGPLVVATLVCFARLWYHHRPVSGFFFFFSFRCHS